MVMPEVATDGMILYVLRNLAYDCRSDSKYMST